MWPMDTIGELRDLNTKKDICLVINECGRGRAFTLVELLVVISIIALLLSVLMPSLNKARNSAKSVACKSNLKQQGYAVMLYVEDNSQRMPPSYIPTNGSSLTNNWVPLISRYIGDKKPSDTFWDQKVSKKVWMCPSYVQLNPGDPLWNSTFQYSYAMNLHLTYAFDPPSAFAGASATPAPPAGSSWAPALKYSRIERPAEKILVSDGAGWQLSFDWQMLYLVTTPRALRHNGTVKTKYVQGLGYLDKGGNGTANVLMAGLNISQDTIDKTSRYAQFKAYPNLYPYGAWKARLLRTW